MKKSILALSIVSATALVSSCTPTSETYDQGYNDYTVAVGVGTNNPNYWGTNSYYYPANPYYRSWTTGYYGYGGNRGYLYRGYGGYGGHGYVGGYHSGFHGGAGGFNRGFAGHGHGGRR